LIILKEQELLEKIYCSINKSGKKMPEEKLDALFIIYDRINFIKSKILEVAKSHDPIIYEEMKRILVKEEEKWN